MKKGKQMTNGLADDTINEIMNIGKWTRANSELDEAKSEFKDVEKYVKTAGVDVKAIKEARAIVASEKRDVFMEHLQNVFRYAVYLGAEVDARTLKQMDLFQIDKSAEPAEDRAFNEGRTMFLLSFGGERPTCPHMEGTPSASSWWSGFSQGETEAKRVMAMAPEADELIKEGSGDPFADFVAGIDEAAPESISEDAEWEAAAPDADDFTPPIPRTPEFDAEDKDV